MDNLNQEIRKIINETYDGGAWEPVTNLYNRDGNAWQLMKFEHTVEFAQKNYWVVIIEKLILAPEDIDCVNDSETIFESFVKI